MYEERESGMRRRAYDLVSLLMGIKCLLKCEAYDLGGGIALKLFLKERNGGSRHGGGRHRGLRAARENGFERTKCVTEVQTIDGECLISLRACVLLLVFAVPACLLAAIAFGSTWSLSTVANTVVVGSPFRHSPRQVVVLSPFLRH